MKIEENSAIFEGSIYKMLIRMALPMLIGMFFQTLYSLIDTYFVSLIDKSSTAIISGLGLVFPLFFFIMAIGQGFNSGVTSLVSIGIGERNYEKINRVGSTAILSSVFIALVVTILGYFYSDLWINLLSGDKITEASKNYAKSYFNIIIYGTILTFSSNVLFGILQGEGKTKYIGQAMIISTIVNIVLDPFFIFYLKLGVEGAAIATVIAQFVSLLFAMSVFFREQSSIKINLRINNFETDIIWLIFKFGFPQSAGLVAMSISFMFLNKLVGAIGEDAMNAFSLVGRMDGFILMPILALAIAVSSTMGQNFGRGNRDRLLNIYFSALKLGFVVVISVATIYIVSAKYFFSLFTDVQTVLDIAVRQVQIMGFVYVGAVSGIISRAAFQSIGKPHRALILTISRMGLLAVPLAYIFAYFVIGFNMESVWYAMVIANLTVGLLSFFWCKNSIKTVDLKESIFGGKKR